MSVRPSVGPSVGWSVGWLVGNAFVFSAFFGQFCITAPAQSHATDSAVYTALFQISLHPYFTVSAGLDFKLRPRDHSEWMQSVILSFFGNDWLVLDLCQYG